MDFWLGYRSQVIYYVAFIYSFCFLQRFPLYHLRESRARSESTGAPYCLEFGVSYHPGLDLHIDCHCVPTWASIRKMGTMILYFPDINLVHIVLYCFVRIP